MRSVSTAMVDLLATSDQLMMAELYTVTLRNDKVFRWTPSGHDVTVDGVTWSAGAVSNGGIVPIVARGPIKCTFGLEVTTVDLTFQCGGGVTIDPYGMPHFTVRIVEP